MRHASNAQTRHDGALARYGPIKQTQIIVKVAECGLQRSKVKITVLSVLSFM